MRNEPSSNRWMAAVALLGVALTALALLFAPIWLLWPTRGQTWRDLTLAYRIGRWAPMAAPLLAVVALALAIRLWRRAEGWWRRPVLILAVLLPAGVVWLSRQNPSEWMFRPLLDPRFARAADADFVGEQDMVLAIEVGGEAVAYPIRQMAYHHILHDTVGGSALVATY